MLADRRGRSAVNSNAVLTRELRRKVPNPVQNISARTLRRKDATWECLCRYGWPTRAGLGTVRRGRFRSKRSRFITLVQAATKSWTNLRPESLQA